MHAAADREHLINVIYISIKDMPASPEHKALFMYKLRSGVKFMSIPMLTQIQRALTYSPNCIGFVARTENGAAVLANFMHVSLSVSLLPVIACASVPCL
jgi:hypothetical protein